jgi:hypothetical protein
MKLDLFQWDQMPRKFLSSSLINSKHITYKRYL